MSNPIPLTTDPSDAGSPKGAIPVDLFGVSGGGGGDSGDVVRAVNHGLNADAERPEGAALVIWSGSVEPTNMVDGDLWVAT